MTAKEKIHEQKAEIKRLLEKIAEQTAKTPDDQGWGYVGNLGCTVEQLRIAAQEID